MDIVLCVDKNYLAPAKVTVASVCIHNIGEKIDFHVITDEKSLDSMKSLSLVTDKYNQHCLFYAVSESICEKMPIERGNRPVYFSKSTYYRLFISSIIPDSIDKVLYLDCDLLCTNSFRELWSTDLTCKAVFAVSDMYEGDVSFYNRLQYFPQEGYFNGGVELINLKYWRDNHIEQVFVNYAVSHADAIFHHDQDIMNYTLKDLKGSLPLKCNVQDGFLYNELHFLAWNRMCEVNEARTNPTIVHYTGRFKPWCKECNHPWKDTYMKLAATLGLRVEEFPVIKEGTGLYKTIRSLLVRCHVIPSTVMFDPSISPLN